MTELNNTTWEEFRRVMPVAKKWAYFDHAAVAPLPEVTRQAIQAWLIEASEEGDTIWPRWASRVEEVREIAARMIGAQSSEIALTPNTTTGISLVAEGFPWKDGDNVVTLANEFPSNLYPWMNLADRGVETRRVDARDGKVSLDALAEACDARTCIVTVSWVGYASGWRLDVGDLVQMAHDRGALVFLDAIQGLGVFPLDVKQTGVDFLAADGHKWMLGPEGAGVLYVRKEHLDLLRPLNVGWNSVKHSHDFARVELSLRPEAARYEGGSQNMAGFHGLGASLELLRDLGVSPHSSPVAERVLDLAELASERLQSAGASLACPQGTNWPREHASGIVSFSMKNRDPQQLRRQLFAAGVVVSCRGGRLRIAPHAYNNEEDIQRLVDTLVDALVDS